MDFGAEREWIPVPIVEGANMNSSRKFFWINTALILACMLSLPTFAQNASKDETGSTADTSTSEKKPSASDDSAVKQLPEKKAPAAEVEASSASDVQELKLRGLEERVNELKEKIFRTKARILQLQETVVSGSIGAGARAVIIHRNEMGGSFKLVSVQYALDTVPIWKKVDVNGDLDGIEEREIHSSNIVPGNHNIAVQMVFQGQGYGFFSYVKGYKFKVTSSYTFTAEEGKIITISVVGFERGGITTKLEERPAIRYDIKIEKLTPDRARTIQQNAEKAEKSDKTDATPSAGGQSG